MSYIFFLFSLAVFSVYWGLKYIACRACLSRRPTLKEFRAYGFANDKLHGRNERAFRYFAVFLAFFGILCLRFTPSLATELQDPGFVRSALKILLLTVTGINFFARNVLYEEELKGDKKFAIPLLEIIDVLKRTRWFVRGSDFISLTVNISTIVMVVIGVSLFLIHFN
jgi:hypothetical protein